MSNDEIMSFKCNRTCFSKQSFNHEFFFLIEINDILIESFDSKI